MLRLSKSRFYSVPVVMRTFDILEFLYASDIPLKTNEISKLAGVPQSTTYRILRTLVQRGYVLQDIEGRFIFERSEKSKFIPIGRTDQCSIAGSLRDFGTDLPLDEIIEILVTLLRTVRSHLPSHISVDGMAAESSLFRGIAERESNDRLERDNGT